MGDARSGEVRNIELVRRLFDAFGTQDVEVLKRAFTADAVFRRVSVGPLPDSYRGPEAIVAFFADLHRETDDTLRLTPLSITASDARVLVLYRITGTRNGKVLETDHVLVFALAHGAITEATMFASNVGALTAFWS